MREIGRLPGEGEVIWTVTGRSLDETARKMHTCAAVFGYMAPVGAGSMLLPTLISMRC